MRSLHYRQPLLTDTEKRDVYYVLRAMHDGACLRCGYMRPSDEFVHRTNGDYSLRCPRCGFEVKLYEMVGIMRITPEVLKRRVESFERNREELERIGRG